MRKKAIGIRFYDGNVILISSRAHCIVSRHSDVHVHGNSITPGMDIIPMTEQGRPAFLLEKPNKWQSQWMDGE